MANKQLLQSAGDGTAVPAGYVGEVKSASAVSASSTSTNATIVYSNATNELLLDAGVWHIYYADSYYKDNSGITGTTPSGWASGKIRNITDNTDVVKLEFITFASTDNDSAYGGAYCLAGVVNITSQKAFRGQLGVSLNSGTQYRFTTRGLGSFYAVRIA